MKAVISNKIYLTYSRELFDKLSKNLTFNFVKGKGMYQTREVVKLCKRIGEKAITIPAACTHLIPEGAEIINKQVKTKIDFPQFRQTLRGEQEDVYNAVEGTCLIEANPGWGKTFIGCALAAKFGLKTLIIVDKSFLKDQWAEEIYKCFGFKPGLLSAGKKSVDTPIVVATVQTLHKLEGKYRDEFGLVIIDEVHKCMAKCFLETLQQYNSSVKIGLSATMGRKDGKHIMFPHLFGLDRYKGETGNELTPKVHVYQPDINTPVGRSWAERITNLFENENYQEFLFNLAESYVEAGYTPLMVVPRKNFLKQVEKRLPTWGIVSGDVKDKMSIANALLEGRLDGIVSEISCFTEGISVNILDCLIHATPSDNRYSLKQLIGRITRPHKGKKTTPVIADIIIPGATFMAQFKHTRLTHYINSGYKIEELQKF